MAKQLHEEYEGPGVSDDMLEEASKLFSENYGVWSEKAAKTMGTFVSNGFIILRSIVVKLKLELGDS